MAYKCAQCPNGLSRPMHQAGDTYKCEDCGHGFNEREYAEGYRSFQSGSAASSGEASDSFGAGWYAAYREHFDGYKVAGDYR